MTLLVHQNTGKENRYRKKFFAVLISTLWGFNRANKKSVIDTLNLIKIYLNFLKMPFSNFYVPAPERCAKVADITFIMDSSDGVGIQNYQIQKDFVNAIAGSFDIQPTGSRVGVVISGNEATLNIKFGDYLHAEDFQQAVNRLPYTPGNAKIDKALQVALTQLLVVQGGARPGVAKVLVLITSGTQNQTVDNSLVDAVAGKLQQLGVAVFLLGAGEKVDVKLLRPLITSDENVFLEKSFESLMMKTRQVAKLACDRAGLFVNRVLKPVGRD